jgi:hypothetical protein
VGLLGAGGIGAIPPPPPPPQAETLNASTTAHAVEPNSRFVILTSAQAVENTRLPGPTYGYGILSICLSN